MARKLFCFLRHKFTVDLRRPRHKITNRPSNVTHHMEGSMGQRQRYFNRMSFLTDVTPLTPRVISTALLILAGELTKPLN